jgi:hypothetical protein
MEGENSVGTEPLDLEVGAYLELLIQTMPYAGSADLASPTADQGGSSEAQCHTGFSRP